MRTIIFSTNEESVDIQRTLGGIIFKRGRDSAITHALMMYLNQDDNAIAIIVGNALLTGWATYNPTLVLFSLKYPTDENVRAQAKGRVRWVEPVGSNMAYVPHVTKESMMNQVKRDRIAFDALPPETRRHYEKQVARIREPSHTNFSDPEAL